MSTRSVLIALFAGVLAASALGQSFGIDWFTVDGGGGTSTGGSFRVSGAVGQPDASPAPMAGGAFSVIGGFWSFDSATPPAVPTAVQIHIALTMSGQIQLNAQATPGAGAMVEATTDLGNPNGWVTLGTIAANGAGLMSFIDTETPNYPMRFYRFVSTPNLNAQ